MTRKTTPDMPPAKAGATLLAVVSVTVLAAVAWAGLALADSAASAAPAAKREGAAQERVEVELITLRPSGFDPPGITRPRGKFILSVENRSGAHEVDLRLDREAGERQHQTRLTRGRLRWGKMVDLPPGRYVLSEANHPDWVCRITITPS